MRLQRSRLTAINMTYLAGLLVLAICLQPYAVLADSTAASAAAAVATAASSGDDDSTVATAAATATATAVTTSTPTFGWDVYCNCPSVYDPVCGSDGKTYSNECAVGCINSRIRGSITIVQRGRCPQRTCNCPKIYTPVCGSDGHTYANQCQLDCESDRLKCLRLGGITRKYYGVCKNTRCCCADTCCAVCGTNGITYKNVCILECNNRYDEARGGSNGYIGVASAGPCKSERCNCCKVYDPVCAKDKKNIEKTFQNKCYLRCHNRRRAALCLAPLKLKNHGKCCNTKCPSVYDPVCASNNKTYYNSCYFNLEKKKCKNLKLWIKHWGACSCRCPLENAPVCASNGKTYSSRCLLNCEIKRCRDLRLTAIKFEKNGPCKYKCQCKKCYQPVCGNDGVTYQNMCWLRYYKRTTRLPLRCVHNGPCGHCK